MMGNDAIGMGIVPSPLLQENIKLRGEIADLRKKLEEAERLAEANKQHAIERLERAQAAEAKLKDAKDALDSERSDLAKAATCRNHYETKCEQLTAKLSRYESGVEVEGIVKHGWSEGVCYVISDTLPDKHFKDGQRVIVNVRQLD